MREPVGARRRGSQTAGMRLILASASPRRRAILAALGIPFDAVVTDVEELREGDPAEVVVENALRKARAGAEGAGEGSVVVGVDTDVALDGRLLGKPGDLAGARRRLEALRGRTHEVFSGVAIVEPGGPPERTSVAVTEVTFRPFDDDLLDLYLRSGEWRDRAGAYAIQGLGSVLIEAISGDFSNVVGLPVGALLELVPALRTFTERN